MEYNNKKKYFLYSFVTVSAMEDVIEEEKKIIYIKKIKQNMKHRQKLMIRL